MSQTPGSRNFGLDALRLAAIMAVILLHARVMTPDLPGPLEHAFSYGWAGVDLFFVLSGFLIADQCYSKPEQSLREFWTKRWTRTLPLYLVVLFFYSVAKPLLTGTAFNGFDWRFFFFLQNIGPLKDFVQSWSLCIEEQFYLVFPFLFFLAGIRKPWVWLSFAALSPALRLLATHLHGIPFVANAPISAGDFDLVYRYLPWNHLDGIAFGVFLAATRSTWTRWTLGTKFALAASGLALELIAATCFDSIAGGWNGITYFSIHAVSFGSFLVLAQAFATTPKGFGWVNRLAIWSYGAYLWNNVFERAIQRNDFQLHWGLKIPLFVGLTFGLAALTYRFIERPGMNLRARLLKGSQASPLALFSNTTQVPPRNG